MEQYTLSYLNTNENPMVEEIFYKANYTIFWSSNLKMLGISLPIYSLNGRQQGTLIHTLNDDSQA